MAGAAELVLQAADLDLVGVEGVAQRAHVGQDQAHALALAARHLVAGAALAALDVVAVVVRVGDEDVGAAMHAPPLDRLCHPPSVGREDNTLRVPASRN